jgi:hypothetical protein
MLAQSRMTSEANMGIGGVVPVGRKLKFGEALEVGLNLARSSWDVVRRVPSLLGVTLLSLVVGGIVAFAYAAALGGPDAMASGGKFVVAIKDFPLFVLFGVIGALAQGVVAVVTRDVFEGRSPSVARGWAAVLAKLPTLVGFGVVFAAERTLTNMLRGKRGTNFAANAIDRAWDFATYLAVPVIMFEPNVGPLSAVKRSASLVRQRWGVQLTATGVIGLAVFVCTIPAIIAAVVVGMATSLPVMIGLVVIVLIAEMCVAGTLQGVCSAVMYRFVTTGAVGGSFSQSQLMRVYGVRPAAGPAFAC